MELQQPLVPAVTPAKLPDYQSAVEHIWRQAEEATFTPEQEKSIGVSNVSHLSEVAVPEVGNRNAAI